MPSYSSVLLIDSYPVTFENGNINILTDFNNNFNFSFGFSNYFIKWYIEFVPIISSPCIPANINTFGNLLLYKSPY